jgi:hypothetical protein
VIPFLRKYPIPPGNKSQLIVKLFQSTEKLLLWKNSPQGTFEELAEIIKYFYNLNSLGHRRQDDVNTYLERIRESFDSGKLFIG